MAPTATPRNTVTEGSAPASGGVARTAGAPGDDASRSWMVRAGPRTSMSSGGVSPTTASLGLRRIAIVVRPTTRMAHTRLPTSAAIVPNSTR